MGSPALIVSHLSKDYHRRTRTLSLREAVKDALLSPFRRRTEDNKPAHALDDVSFEVRKGDVVGVIGHNGAGKSTLLKILSRVTDPTGGRAEIHGRIGSLLEVGTGFHPELTGRENIYLSAAILGMSRAEIDRRFERIVEFSDISPAHLEMPVKKYSSGMYVRLGFSVASHLEPDILLIDEVLSVGDMAFQRKCLTRMRALTREARIILLVTHNMMSVRGICNRAILLSRGRIAAEGTPDTVIPTYERLALAGESDDARQLEIDHGMGQIKIIGLTLFNSDGQTANAFEMGAPIRLRIDYDAVVKVPHVIVYAGIRKLDGFICSGTSTEAAGVPVPELSGPGTIELEFPSVSVTPGMYVMDVTFYDENFEHRQYFLGRRRITFHVESPLGPLDDRYGIVYPHARWTIRN